MATDQHSKYAVDQRRSGFGLPSMAWTNAGPIWLIKYAVAQCRSGFGLPIMLWTSAGPILLIKYTVDQRTSDLAHHHAVDQRRSDFAYQIYCGPAQVLFCSSSNMLWTSAGLVLAHQLCCGPAHVIFCASNILWTSASPF